MIFSFSHALVTVTLILSSAPGVKANRCKKLKRIFSEGENGGKGRGYNKDNKHFVELSWSDSFVVVDDEEEGYDMWFDEDLDVNPNEEVTKKIFGEKIGFENTVDFSVDQCHLQSYHKKMATEEDLDVCKPWRNKESCCKNSVVGTENQIKTNYGREYVWDVCGKLSRKCEKYFVQEACFYECEPAAGLYRKHLDPQSHPEWAKHEHVFDEESNAWQMYKMPIKKSFSDAWYEACKDDYFCVEGGFFKCAKLSESFLSNTCGDDPKEEPSGEKYSCAKLAKKESSILKEKCDKPLVNGACPETCAGNCTCTDSGDTIWDKRGKNYTCKELRKFSSRKRAKMCDRTYAFSRCPATCGGWCKNKDFK